MASNREKDLIISVEDPISALHYLWGEQKRRNKVYWKMKDGNLIDIENMNQYPPEQIVLITTGSQGEPMSALTRMAMHDHKKVNITPMDFIIISATRHCKCQKRHK